MNGLALDSGEFISADELNARWLPRKATEEEMSKEQPEALPVRLAKRLCDGISTGHDWPNTDDELLRMQSAAELRRLHAENEALRAQIGHGVPVAWIRWEWNRSGRKSLVFEKPTELSLAEEATGVIYEPLYTHPAPQQKPLTDEQIKDCLDAADQMYCLRDGDKEIFKARAIEAAHNIGEKK